MSKHVVIVGAGVIGLCTAYYCARKGFSVTVVDRNSEQRDGCSFGNAGMIVPSHFVPLAAPGMVKLGLKWMWNPASPFYIKPRFDTGLISWGAKFWRAANAAHVERAAPLIRDLSLGSRACFEELAVLPGVEFGLVRHGLLMLCQTQHALDEEAHMAERAARLGIPAEVRDSKQTSELEPGVEMAIAGSVLYPLDCHLDPLRFMQTLEAGLKKLGARFAWNAEATSCRKESQIIRALELAGKDSIEGDEFVLCGGSWTPQLADELALKLPMQAGKGYSLTLPRPRQLPRICSILVEARVAVTPMGGRLRVGGTMEIAGLNEDISPVRVQGIVNSFCRYYPAFQRTDFDGVQPWRGLRPCSPDGLPYVGRTRAYRNLSIASGHAMMGLSLGPVTGKMIAGILSGEPAQWDITMLSPDRYN